MIKLLVHSYPNWKKDVDQEDLQVTAELFYRNLSDLPSNDVALALNEWIRDSQFPPTVADLRKHATEHSRQRRRLLQRDSDTGERYEVFYPDADFLRDEEQRGIPREVLTMMFHPRLWPREWNAESAGDDHRGLGLDASGEPLRTPNLGLGLPGSSDEADGQTGA